MAYASIIATLLKLLVGAFVLLAAPMADVATAQSRPGPAAEFEGGWVGFADDGIVSEGLVGGAVRLYVGPRLSVGPEVVYIHGNNHNHVVVTGNVTWDLLAATNGRPHSITPFFVLGAGVFRTREKFSSDPFASSEGAFTAGGGVRAAVGDRVTVGLAARIGWELHLRVSGLVGLRLGRFPRSRVDASSV